MKHWALLLLLALFAGCDKHHHDDHHQGEEEHDHETEGNRIEFSAVTRANLGIRFAPVESRRVAATVRVPGRFEPLPSGIRDYHMPIAGRVDYTRGPTTLKQYDRVERGEVLFRIQSPAWHDLQRDLGQAQADLARAETELAAAIAKKSAATAKRQALANVLEATQAHIESLHQSLEPWQRQVERLRGLQGSTGGRALELSDAEGRLADARTSLAEARERHAELQLQIIELESLLTAEPPGRAPVEAEIDVRRAALAAAQSGWQAQLETAARILDVEAQSLTETNGAQPLWKTLETLEVRATAPGVVADLFHATGSWVGPEDLVVETIDPSALRFVATLPQSELGRLVDGTPGRVVPPEGGHLDPLESIEGEVRFGLKAQAENRTIELLFEPKQLLAWARPGVAAYLELTVASSDGPVLAVPRSAIVRDGLHDVLFRRDPHHPDEVIRLEAELGVSDGRWVEIRGGLQVGDEVVTAGVYALLLSQAEEVEFDPHAGHSH